MSQTLQVLKQLGISDGSSITRSHIIVEQGGEVSLVSIGVSSKESVPQVLAAVNAK